MQEAISALRQRFHEYRRTETSLALWRELQIEILAVARAIERGARADGLHTPETLWLLFGEAFWMEHDLTRLAVLVEEALDAIERHPAVRSVDR